MKNLHLIFIFLALAVTLAVVPADASGTAIKIPASQWKDTTSLVRGYGMTSTASLIIRAPAYTAVSIPTPTYTEKDNGTIISLTRDSVVKIQLKENPTTGFSWNTTESSGIQVLSSTYQSSAPGRFGAGGIHTWVIKVTGTDTQQFNGVYKQPWMPSSVSDSKYTISFVVR
ncbi:MAG TPA: protease inhibitor I42 family protein [Methanoregulaceae archaeon]|nr:protease inhibitor I42 family protein [Methanoregulaceae archaeon]